MHGQRRSARRRTPAPCRCRASSQKFRAEFEAHIRQGTLPAGGGFASRLAGTVTNMAKITHRRPRGRGARGPERHRGGAGARDRDPALLLPPAADGGAATAACAWSRSRGSPKLADRLQHPVRRTGMVVLTTTERGAARPARRCSSSSSSTTRSTARSATRRGECTLQDYYIEYGQEPEPLPRGEARASEAAGHRAERGARPEALRALHPLRPLLREVAGSEEFTPDRTAATTPRSTTYPASRSTTPTR